MWNRPGKVTHPRVPTGALAAALVLAAICAGLAGCETIEDRIARHQAFFESLDPDTQATLRAGEVKLGYTPTMALIAFGSPDAVVHRTSAAGDASVWLYRSDYPIYEGTELVGYRLYGVRGQVPEYREWYRYESQEYLRLTFRGGRITEIERLE